MSSVEATVYNTSTGTVQTAYGLYSYVRNFNSGGAISNAYGLYVQQVGSNITNGYGVYQLGAPSNYFE